jgi:hypothetical protein
MRKSWFAFAAIAALSATMTATVFAADAGKWMVGSKADIAGVTAAQMQVWGANPERGKIMGMHVVGDYALDVWTELHICCPSAVFKRVSAERWKRVTGSGGDSPLPMAIILNGGVPASIAHRLCSGWPKGYGPCD